MMAYASQIIWWIL